MLQKWHWIDSSVTRWKNSWLHIQVLICVSFPSWNEGVPFKTRPEVMAFISRAAKHLFRWEYYLPFGGEKKLGLSHSPLWVSPMQLSSPDSTSCSSSKGNLRTRLKYRDLPFSILDVPVQPTQTQCPLETLFSVKFPLEFQLSFSFSSSKYYSGLWL